MSQACRLAMSWELYILKCGLIGYIFRSLQSKLVSIMGEWVGLGVFPGTNYYCWICGSAKNSTTKNWYWLYIGMPIICVHHVFDAWWFGDKSQMKQSVASNTERMTWKHVYIYTYSYNWFSITSFAEQVGANHGGEGGPWPGASSSLPCLPCQQVTYSRISTCQQFFFLSRENKQKYLFLQKGKKRQWYFLSTWNMSTYHFYDHSSYKTNDNWSLI